ncbi:hypothetical protein B0H67DRAFT_561028 [Lasiosphaeris hirsuta]|uniref:Uncharacterized protein n=1 Tax=Lasiosphaeris hirsuta TaxID=260670 RepID=A0AA40B9N1_9PEZI|nr:hypothetical protein B0H67DRAFT_561028 [Lasiosphaeris hirsuta]
MAYSSGAISIRYSTFTISLSTLMVVIRLFVSRKTVKISQELSSMPGPGALRNLCVDPDIFRVLVQFLIYT